MVSIPTLANGDHIAGLNADKGGGAVGSQVLMSLLIAIVFLHIVEIVTTHNNGAFHLGAHNDARENTSTDGDIPSEGTLLVDIDASDGLLGSLEAKTNILIPTGTLTLSHNTLVVEEDGFLLLETALVLQNMDG